LKVNPENAPLVMRLGTMHEVKGDEKAIALDPKFSWSYYNMGNIYKTKSNFDMAIKMYDTSIG
jgi:tetratricopeptide (TPR) repeat protein